MVWSRNFANETCAARHVTHRGAGVLPGPGSLRSVLGNGTGLGHSCPTGPHTATMTFRPLALCLWLALLALPAARAEQPSAPRRLEGEIGGARWTMLVPVEWNGRLLLAAPDRRRAPAPLVAELDASTPEHAALLASGWALATTSYRRTGPIIIDAIDDLLALRNEFARRVGPPRLVIVQGTGMGGLIATFLAERHADEFHGLLACDPSYELRDPRALRLRCDHQPRAPLLVLFGAATIPGAVDYGEKARAAANAESVVPALWYQPTPNEEPNASAIATRLDAIDALVAWVQTRTPPPHRLEHLPVAEEEAAAERPANGPAGAAPKPAAPPPLPDEPPPTIQVDPAPAATR